MGRERGKGGEKVEGGEGGGEERRDRRRKWYDSSEWRGLGGFQQPLRLIGGAAAAALRRFGATAATAATAERPRMGAVRGHWEYVQGVGGREASSEVSLFLNRHGRQLDAGQLPRDGVKLGSLSYEAF